ncbi:dual specificity protein kinase TTK isoform 4-T5 [Liasis olivaceus]
MRWPYTASTGCFCNFSHLKMQEDDLSEKGLFVASIMSRVRDLKSKYKNEDNITDELNFTKASTDTTDNSGTVNQIMMTANNPEDWLSFLLKMEKKGTFQTDTSLLNRLIGRYSQAVAALSAEKYSQNENYAHIMVRFAELKAIEEPEEARDQFHLARLNCKKFAFVHVAFAQFELSQGNVKKAKQLLEKGAESRAVPAEMLEIALRNLNLQKPQLLSVEEKEKLTAPSLHNITGNFQNKKKNTDFSEITASIPNFFPGEKNDSSRETELVFGGRKPLTQLNKSNQICTFGRVPLKLINESDSDTDESLKIKIPTNVAKRQISGTNLIQLSQPKSKPNRSDSYLPEDLKPLPIRSLIESDEENSEVAISSTLTLKEKYDPIYVKKRETETLKEQPRTTESACLEGQQQPLFSLGSNQKEKEQFKLNCLASKNKWPHLETQHKRNSEVSASVPPNECILVKGKWYSVLKQIGSGGSSKVFQVLDEKKQLYAIKYVHLEEADQQTIESYKNEIAHLNKLQQHSDKIIRLYDYEISEKSIYMVLECGNIDLNSWLKKKKTINPWERKSYWKNMLEAVHTIHQHGIVHSDLKPANFLLVDGMLKLIDFGIANQMQPDVTSIVKDSQVGTINYMPPEAIKDMSSSGENGKSRSKISPKSDVWSLGCILYCMTYGRTPFQNITNYITKLHAIIDPNYEIMFPDIAEKDLLDVLKNCLVRNPKQRISVTELLIHPYVHIQSNSQTGHQNAKGTTEEMKRILGHLIGLNSPNSISKAARTLYEQCNNGEGLDVSAFSNSDSRTTWKTK